MNFRRFLILATLLVFLSGCQTVSSGMHSVSNGVSSLWPWSGRHPKTLAEREADIQPTGPENCPSVALADELNEIHQFTDPTHPSPATAISSVKITGVKATCSANADNVIVDIDLAVKGSLGPKARITPNDKPSFSYPYFLAVTDPSGDVVAKQVFASALSYNVNQQEQAGTETIRQIIPLKGAHKPNEYKLQTGFQLSADELAYNQSLPKPPVTTP